MGYKVTVLSRQGVIAVYMYREASDVIAQIDAMLTQGYTIVKTGRETAGSAWEYHVTAPE